MNKIKELHEISREIRTQCDKADKVIEECINNDSDLSDELIALKLDNAELHLLLAKMYLSEMKKIFKNNLKQTTNESNN